MRFCLNRMEIYFILINCLPARSRFWLFCLTVLGTRQSPRGRCLLDEPEVSLHVEWQQRLISLIRQLNPNVQIVLTTHSPAVIMDGWLDAVTEVSDITK